VSSSAEAALDVLREQVRSAAAAHRPLRLRGAGTKDFYGEALDGEVLELRAHRGIVDYDASELVISARCGTPLSEIAGALAVHAQQLAFEPPAFDGDPTIGGVIAAGLSGPRRPYAGAARDFVLGAALLTASGEVLRFGGRVMKNVAGFDVSRLLCGSLGILGVITEVSLKVLPTARAEETLRLELGEPAALEAFNRWAGAPVPLSAAAWWRGCAWVRLSGAQTAVGAARAQLGGERVDAAEAAEFWRALRDCRLGFFERAPLWRLSLPSAAAPLADLGEPLIDWGGAVRWYAQPAPGVGVRERAVAAGGTAQCWRGAAPGMRFHPLPPAVAGLHRRLKGHFDPLGIFNPGRLVLGL
jgi:glycolate oxidase FAD binding subunit